MGYCSIVSVRGHRRYGPIRGRGLWLVVLTILGLMALPAAAAQADDVWTGGSTPPTSDLWSTAGNWSGRVLPTSTAGVLTFPDLSSNSACTATPPTAACYTSHNDLSGISATSLVLSNTTPGTQYRILGNSLSITGGITDNSGGNTGDVINAPLALSGTQSWAIGLGFGTQYNSLSLTGAVTGSSSPVNVTFPTSAGSTTGDLFVVNDMEVGAVAINGVGGLHVGGASTPGSVNGTNGHTVTINTGATLIANPGATVGSLTLHGAELLLGTGLTNTGTTTLGVTGAATLDSASTTTTYINDNGSTPGTAFSQVSATGNVSLAGQLFIGQGVGSSGCAVLNNGDVATLITTTGTLSGTFTGVPDGTILTMNGGSCQSTPPQVQIHYSANSVTATVISGTTPTTTTLATPNPSSAATNQPVTLTATASTNTNGTVAPAGTVAFSANGTVIPGCTSQPVTASGSTGTATCTTSFAAASSPESLTAAFTGSTGSGQASSSSAPQSLTVNKASTATALAVSNTSPSAGGSVTYTATVTPGIGGASTPSGNVQFLDGGGAITGCSGRPLTVGSSSTAKCTVSYASAGSHSITAAYGGDANFVGSSSSATSVTVKPPPPPPGISATTSPATRVGTTQATLNGSVDTGGATVTWKFEYGRSTTYNQATPLQTIAAGQHGTVSLSSVVKRLSPKIRYHYRLVVFSQTSTSAAASGNDLTFNTRATGRLLGPAGRLLVIGRTILVVEKCQSSVRCAGRFSLTTTVHVGPNKTLATVVCATGGFRIRAHRTATTRVRLSAACARLLRSQRHHRLVVTYTAQSRTGQLGLRRRVTLVLR
jgi:large repetitive protein